MTVSDGTGDASGALRRGQLRTVGEFARRCRLPVSTLHHYHEIGLLEPERVDPRTGYRYYHDDQLERAVLIARLRTVGLDPELIRALVTESSTDRDWRVARDRLVADIDGRIEALRRFDQVAARRRTPPDSDAPTLIPMPAAWQATHTLRADASRLAPIVRRGLARLRRSVDPGASVAATFELDIDRESTIVRLHVESPRPPSGPPMVLASRHHGAHDDLWTTYRSLLDEAERRGLHPGGAVTERYRPTTDGHLHTEVLLHLTGEPS